MTMIDEGTLSDLLRKTADDFEVSEVATHRFMDQMRVDQSSSAGVTRFVRQPRRTRNVIMGVAALVIALAIGVPLAAQEPHGPLTVVRAALAPITSRGHSGEKSLVPSAPPATAGTGLGIVTNSEKAATSKTATSEKIESTGTIGVTVARGHVHSAFSTLTSIAAGDHGFVESSEASTAPRARGRFATGAIVIEVPQAAFNHLVAQVQGVGRATSVITNSNDVTSQYVNLQARIDALKVSSNQYLKIMTRATTINGIHAVQQRIDQIESQIEQEQGQLNVLNHETTYASLTVHVATPAHHAISTKRSGLDKAWHDSVGGFISGFEWLARLAGPVLFALLALGALGLLARLAWRSIRRRTI
ncbi:MAG: DUF4349 domain-containing protein [Acidimicrobiales bacterium]